MRPISKLQFITTNAQSAARACEGGIDWIQLRVKDVDADTWRNVALEVQAVCKKYGATFILNDNIALALEIGADGVHVGKEDPLPQHLADEMISRGGIIGCTANTIDDIKHLEGKPVSYIGLGPFRFTETKKKLSPVLGLHGYTTLLQQLTDRHIAHPPIVGIGGIVVSDVTELLKTGLHGIAVSGAIGAQSDITAAARTFVDAIKNNDHE